MIGFFEAFIVGVIDLQAGQGLQLAAVQTTVARTQFPHQGFLAALQTGVAGGVVHVLHDQHAGMRTRESRLPGCGYFE